MTYPKKHWRSSSLKKLHVSSLDSGPNVSHRYVQWWSVTSQYYSRTDHLSMFRLTYVQNKSKCYYSMKEAHSQGCGRVRLYFKMIFSLEGHQQLTVSSPYRWWFCGLMSTLPLLPPAPPHCCCDLFSPSWFLLSCPVVHITWNPWVSIVKSSMLRNGIRNQSVLFFPSFFHPLWGHVTVYSLEATLCFKPR